MKLHRQQSGRPENRAFQCLWAISEATDRPASLSKGRTRCPFGGALPFAHSLTPSVQQYKAGQEVLNSSLTSLINRSSLSTRSKSSAVRSKIPKPMALRAQTQGFR